jgi:hypothetical protein
VLLFPVETLTTALSRVNFHIVYDKFLKITVPFTKYFSRGGILKDIE